MIDYPELMARFRDILAQQMIELNSILRAFSGNTEEGGVHPRQQRALQPLALSGVLCARAATGDGCVGPFRGASLPQNLRRYEKWI
jgi:hypothetical protein